MAIITTNTNLNSISYSEGETIEVRNGATLMIDTTPAVRPGSIICITRGEIRLECQSVDLPLVLTLEDMNHDIRAEGQGRLVIRGKPIEIGPGTGEPMTWNFAQILGGAVPEVTYVEVELTPGSGDFMPWAVVHEDPRFDNTTGLGICYGSTSRDQFCGGTWPAGRVFFWHDSNRTLSTGDGINGCLVPVGCRVRIPNIYITNRLKLDETYSWGVSSGYSTVSGGTFKLTIDGKGTTEAIPHNASAAYIKAALEALPGMVAGATSVTSVTSSPGNWTIVYAGAMVNSRAKLSVDYSGLTGFNKPHFVSIESSAANMSLIDIDPAGAMDAEWCAFSGKIFLRAVAFSSLRLRSVGAPCTNVSSSSMGSVEINGLVAMCPPLLNIGSVFGSVYGPVSLARIVSGGKHQISSKMIIEYLPKLLRADDLMCIIYSGDRSTNILSDNIAAIIATALPPGTTLRRPISVGGPMFLRGMTDTRILDAKLADLPRNSQPGTTHNISGIIVEYCEGCTISGVRAAGPSMFRNFMVVPRNGSRNTTVLDVDVDGGSSLYAVLQPTGSGMKSDRIKATNLRSGGVVIAMPGSFLGTAPVVRKAMIASSPENATAGAHPATGARYDLVTSTTTGVMRAHSGISDWAGANYCDPGLTPTTGHVTFGPFSVGACTDLTGTAWLDQLGRLYLPTPGDSATVTIPFAMHAITAMKGLPPLLLGEVPGSVGTTHVLAANANPTGGTFVLGVQDAAGAPIGTTAPIAFNASAATIDAALEAILGTLDVAVSGSSMASGMTMGFTAPVAVSINPAGLTGGSDIEVYANLALSDVERADPGLQVAIATRAPGGIWSDWLAPTPEVLSSVPCDPSAGVEVRLRLTVPGSAPVSPRRAMRQVTLRTNIAPDAWWIGDATIELQGPAATDSTAIYLADGTLIASLLGPGEHEISVGQHIDRDAFLVRRNEAGIELMRTQSSPFTLKYGDNGVMHLFSGQEVQLAQSGEVSGMQEVLNSVAYSVAEFKASSGLVAEKVEALRGDVRVVKAAVH